MLPGHSRHDFPTLLSRRPRLVPGQSRLRPNPAHPHARQRRTQSHRRSNADNLKAFGEPEADFVFIFRTLRVQGGWAWAEAEPQRTGSEAGRFESVSFLLRKASGGWRVAESLPDDVASADEPDKAMSGWLKSITKKYPKLPIGVLPAR